MTLAEHPMFLIARFHARAGCEAELEQAIAAVAVPTRQESGCLQFHAFQSNQDRRLFFIHSSWSDEAAFDHHATRPHTVAFIARADALVDEPLAISRLSLIV